MSIRKKLKFQEKLPYKSLQTLTKRNSNVTTYDHRELTEQSKILKNFSLKLKQRHVYSKEANQPNGTLSVKKQEQRRKTKPNTKPCRIEVVERDSFINLGDIKLLDYDEGGRFRKKKLKTSSSKSFNSSKKSKCSSSELSAKLLPFKIHLKKNVLKKQIKPTRDEEIMVVQDETVEYKSEEEFISCRNGVCRGYSWENEIYMTSSAQTDIFSFLSTVEDAFTSVEISSSHKAIQHAFENQFQQIQASPLTTEATTQMHRFKIKEKSSQTLHGNTCKGVQVGKYVAQVDSSVDTDNLRSEYIESSINCNLLNKPMEAKSIYTTDSLMLIWWNSKKPAIKQSDKSVVTECSLKAKSSEQEILLFKQDMGDFIAKKSTSNPSLFVCTSSMNCFDNASNTNGDVYYNLIKSKILTRNARCVEKESKLDLHMSLSELYTVEWIQNYLFAFDDLLPYNIVLSDKVKEVSEVVSLGSFKCVKF